MKSYFAGGAVCIAAIALGWQSSNVSPITNPPTRVAGLDAHDGSAAGSLLGQFRTNTSAWLWIHADLYLHNGVHMRPITASELKSGIMAETEAKDGNESLDAESMVTVVPPAERDFRGLFGDVDRAVSSWKDMHHHSHNDPEQCLPMYRLMTWLDPQFIDGWTMGAMVFARDRSPGGTLRASSFLSEGLAVNPDSLELMTELAYVYLTRKKAYPEAIVWLEKAREIGYGHRLNLPEAERASLENTYRWLALCYRETGKPEEVRLVATEGLTLYPDDHVLSRLLEHAEEKGTDAGATAEGMRTGQ